MPRSPVRGIWTMWGLKWQSRGLLIPWLQVRVLRGSLEGPAITVGPLFQSLRCLFRVLRAGLTVPCCRIRPAVPQEGRRGGQVHLGIAHELRGYCVVEGVRGHALDRCAFRLTARGQSGYTGSDPIRLLHVDNGIDLFQQWSSAPRSRAGRDHPPPVGAGGSAYLGPCLPRGAGGAAPGR
jgi:hypothetical protein